MSTKDTPRDIQQLKPEAPGNIEAHRVRAPARIAQLVDHFGLRSRFPDAVMREVSELRTSFAASAAPLRRLTELPFVTIDNEDSKDLDQALWITRPTGTYKSPFTVLYALADAGYFVSPGSALFQEAMQRGVTYYLPGFSVPMLPRPLSEDLVSLNPEVERRALVFRLELDEQAHCKNMSFSKAIIKSAAKLSYAGVQKFLDGGKELAGKPYSETLSLLRTVGELRVHDAIERDVVRYDRYETEIAVPPGNDGRLVVRAQPHLAVETWNAEISLLCNIEGARYLRTQADPELDVEGIFRIHPRPSASSLGQLESAIERLVDALQLSPEIWKWRRAQESLADFLQRLPDDSQGWRLAMAIQRQALMLNRKAEFSTQVGAHYGIGAAQYSRFSSPMRELVGILTHQLAVAQAYGEPSGLDRTTIETAIQKGNRAQALQKQISRTALKLALDDHFAPDLSEHSAGSKPQTHTGTVMGVSRGRIHIRLDNPPVDIKVHTPHLADESDGELEGNDDGTELWLRELDGKKRLLARLGNVIRLRVSGYDSKRERWLFSID